MRDMHGVGDVRLPCEDCGRHLATVTLDLSGSVPVVHMCGLCALKLVLEATVENQGSLPKPS